MDQDEFSLYFPSIFYFLKSEFISLKQQRNFRISLCVFLRCMYQFKTRKTSLSLVGTNRRSASSKIGFRFYDFMNCFHAFLVLCVSVNDGQNLQTFSGHVLI